MKNRKPNRLRNYDYSQNGMYFITICAKDRFECFGEIKNGRMILNNPGKIAENLFLKIPNHFSSAFLDEFVIMSNHIHGIIEINVGNAYMRSLQSDRSKMLLSKVIHGYKSSVTREFNRLKKYNVDFKWQKSFYDHIIRNEISLNKIREYIQTNPEMWKRDRNNVENLWM